MGQDKVSFARSIQGHTRILGWIYAFLGWLGLGGACLLLVQSVASHSLSAPGVQAGLWNVSPPLALLLLALWSLLLLNFAKDIAGKRTWSTGIGGILIGCFSLLSVPIGTAVGTYTLWVLFHLHRLN